MKVADCYEGDGSGEGQHADLDKFGGAANVVANIVDLIEQSGLLFGGEEEGAARPITFCFSVENVVGHGDILSFNESDVRLALLGPGVELVVGNENLGSVSAAEIVSPVDASPYGLHP